MGALNILKCQAASNANHTVAVVVFHLWSVPYQIVVVTQVENHIAIERAVVAKMVVLSQVVATFRVLFLIAAVANSLAFAQAVQRFALVAVVQSPVGALAVHVANIVLYI